MKRILKEKMLRMAVASGLIFSLGSSLAQAMPSGGEVLQGKAGVSSGGAEVGLSAALPNWASIWAWQSDPSKPTVIRWQSFDIGQNEALTFDKNINSPLVNLVASGRSTEIAGTIEQYAVQPVYIVNPSGIHLGSTAALKANDLILSTVEASEDDWKNLTHIDSASAKGEIRMDSGAGVEVHGGFKTQSTTLNVADGVWFTIDPDTNTTSGWSEGSVSGNWPKGTVELAAAQTLNFSGTLNQADGRANEKPIEVSLSGRDIKLTGGKLNVWGNAADAIRLTGTDSITVDGTSLYANGGLTLDSPSITAKNGAQLTADGTKTSTSSIQLDETSKADGFTAAGTAASGGTGESAGAGGTGESTETGETTPAEPEQPVTAAAAAAEDGMPTGGQLLTGGVVITHQDAARTSDTTNLNSGDTVRSTAPTFINWDSYTLGTGKTLNYDTAGGAILNRVTGSGVTELLGRLKVCGSAPVYIVNANGVVLGQGVLIDANQLVLSGLDVEPTAALAALKDGGDLTFAAAADKAGTITLDTGAPSAAAGNFDTTRLEPTPAVLATGSLSILGRTVSVAPDTYLYIEPTKTLEGTDPAWTQGHLQLVAADSVTLGSEGGTLGLKSFAATAANTLTNAGYLFNAGFYGGEAHITAAGGAVTQRHSAGKRATGSIYAYDDSDITIKGTEKIVFDGVSQGFSDGSHIRADGKITFDAPVIQIKLPTEIAGKEIGGLDAGKTSIAAGSDIGGTYYKEAVISTAEKEAAEKAAAEQAAREAAEKAAAEQAAKEAAEKAAAEQAAKEEKQQAETVYDGQKAQIASWMKEEPQSRQTTPDRSAARDEMAGDSNDEAVTFAN